MTANNRYITIKCLSNPIALNREEFRILLKLSASICRLNGVRGIKLHPPEFDNMVKHRLYNTVVHSNKYIIEG